MDRQCPSCGGFCKKSGCERENAKPKEWVGLTDDEVFEFADTNLYEGGKNYGILSFGKAIEQALKDKNA